MVTMAKRIETLRTEKGLSRAQLSSALGLKRMACEKFETGRQTPTQEQQKKLAAFFGVSLSYLKGETDDKTSMESWLNDSMDGVRSARPAAAAPARRPAPAAPQVVAQSGGGSATFSDALLKSPAFKSVVQEALRELLKTEEGKRLIQNALR